ncbi:MAG TPA: saccharopine dehydrogenase NADP-binding domain-containing protein, partial [Pseudomonadales bacterium]|nr:saccharopine dehydrogenase NADP-binding domain-containing protein [Pseudomonadales bacterium]
MAKQIVLFGATGYTGHLTAEALLKRRCYPLLAGRNQISLKILAERLGGLNFRIADINRPQSLRDLLEPGDVLISTVGPFGRYGKPVLEAAIEQRAHYIDSTGEPNFIKFVHSKQDAVQAAGICALTATGYDYFPGNCAAAAALRLAGEQAARVDVGYFIEGGGPLPMSQGTLASTL